MTGLVKSVLQIKTKIVSSHTAGAKPVKQEVNGTVIHPPLVFPGLGFDSQLYLVIYHKIANDSTTTETFEKNKQRFGTLRIQKMMNVS